MAIAGALARHASSASDSARRRDLQQLGRTGSGPVFADTVTAYRQAERRALVVGAKEMRAQSLAREQRAFDFQRDIVASAFADIIPRGANSRAMFVVEQHAEIRRLVCIARFGGNKRDNLVEERKSTMLN